MDRKETIQIITLLAGNYDSIAKKDTTQKQLMVNTWHECLNDLDYNLVLISVKKTIIESQYPPTISDVRKNAINIINPTNSNVLEHWDECYRMICNGSYMTVEEFEKHSNEVKRFLGSLTQLRNYAKSDIDIINTVVKGQFMKQYEVIKQREREEKLLPRNMLDLIQNSIKMIE